MAKANTNHTAKIAYQKKIIKDLKKIISIQENIISKKESEHQMVHNLFMHYLDKSCHYTEKYFRSMKLLMQSEMKFASFVVNIISNKGGFNDK